MASERGAANLRRYNDDRSKDYLALVEECLKMCRKRKLQFKSAGMLAAYISDQTKVHRTTLLRNVRYKVVLAAYMATQPGAASFVDEKTNDPNILRAKLASTQAEVGVLRGELKQAVARLASSTAVSPAIGNQKGVVDFANLCVVLCLIISRAETFAIDMKRRQLIDLSARQSRRVVADSDRLAAFASWMEQNSSLPCVKEVTRS